MKIKGLLVTLNGNCRHDINGLYNVFLPSDDAEKVLDYVKGNGDIISYVRYTIDTELLSVNEKKLILDRMLDFM